MNPHGKQQETDDAGIGMMQSQVRRLPVQYVHGQKGKFFRDNRLREFRNVDLPFVSVPFDDLIAQNGACGDCGGPLEVKSEDESPECYDPDCGSCATACLIDPESLEEPSEPTDDDLVTSCCYADAGNDLREPEGDADNLNCNKCGRLL